MELDPFASPSNFYRKAALVLRDTIEKKNISEWNNFTKIINQHLQHISDNTHTTVTSSTTHNTTTKAAIID